MSAPLAAASASLRSWNWCNKAEIAATSWQYVRHQHNRHAFDRGIARIDAIDGGKVLAFQDILGHARSNCATGLHQNDPVTEARGEGQVVQRHHDGAARRRQRGEVVE